MGSFWARGKVRSSSVVTVSHEEQDTSGVHQEVFHAYRENSVAIVPVRFGEGATGPSVVAAVGCNIRRTRTTVHMGADNYG